MSKECELLHKLFCSLPRQRFPFEENAIFNNGIYVLFEKGESAHGGERIVRVGTHTGKGQLRSRLKQHFLMENKDRSIFRKNIGRALLNKSNDPFLSLWELDLTPKEARQKHSQLIDFDKQKKIEKEVTNYIQSNFSFVVIPIEEKEERLMIESKLISTINCCEECRQSGGWLGNYSPKEKIRESGLWLVNELNKNPLTTEETELLAKTILQGKY